ncbi:MAG: HipA domain-containing protein [Desulfuromonadales bacterium]|nr:HipA domain-containing protein [Desulfuromonadales bacterium]MBN2791096.1 HipA domain-containing protein [Desulfuromonadales bacterium]
MRDRQKQQLYNLLSHRALTSRELVQGLNISQPTLSRLIQSLSHDIIVMGKGRATSYGLPRHSDGQGSRLPIYIIDPRGDAQIFGHLIALQGGQYWLEQAEGSGELHSGIPWQLQDLLVSGYVARSFAYRHCESLHLPRRLADWSSEDKLLAASRFGENQIGNLLIGEESLARYFAQAREEKPLIELDDRPWMYPQLAQKTLTGEVNNALFSGEQPKFSVCINDQGTPCHMLVKFSPAVDSNEARRYADLLVCEHLALEAVRTAGHNTARSRVVIAGHQAFLCLKRFDRRGLLGRLPSLSLKSLHARIESPCDNWIDAAIRLEKKALINTKDAQKLRWLSLFSDLIGNTNQHFHNISLIPHQRNYILAPVYGIRPTLYEPIAGEIPQRLFTPPSVRNDVAADLPSAMEAAIFFWKSAAVDERISAEFRQICYENCELLKLQQQGPRLIL